MGHRNSLLLLLLGSIVATILVLYNQPPPLPSLVIPVTQTSMKPQTVLPVSFHDASLKWRLIAGHRQSSEHLTALTETLGSGVCVIDANQDGWMDLFVVGGSGHTRHYGKQSWWNKPGGNKLLINRQGNYLEDISDQAGFTEAVWGMGCAVADFNNDGTPDIYLTAIGTNIIYKNQGDLNFEEVIIATGTDKNQWSTSPSLVDFNNDGLIDIYVSNYVQYQKGSRIFERASGYNAQLNIAYDQSLYNPAANNFYKNFGHLKFDDIATVLKVSNPQGRSLGSRWFDINQDSWPDLFVINDRGSPSRFFINKAGKGFSRNFDRTAAFEVSGVQDLSIADFDNNGSSEFFMSRGIGNSPVFLKEINEADGQLPYRDINWQSGAAQTRLLAASSWGTIAADFNNDGFLDIYQANGNTIPDSDSTFVAQAQKNTLLLNKGNGSFMASVATVDPLRAYSSRGVISVDLNNDGHLELIISNNNDPLQIFENNEATGNWIGLDFSEMNEATRYGTKVTATTDKGKIVRTVSQQQSFLSQGDPRLHIGLADATEVQSIDIEWRDGNHSRFTKVASGHYYRLNKDSVKLDPVYNAKAKTFKFASLIPSIVNNVSENMTRDTTNAASDNLAGDTLETLLELLPLLPPRYVDLSDLTLVWHRTSDASKRVVLHNLIQHWNINGESSAQIAYLHLIRLALADANKDIKLMAISLLKKAELETSTAWLIPLLGDDNPEVQCAIANAFEFFFDEEESITHRKKLAISPLIKILTERPYETTICVADALAAAESKRAILPLMEIARSEIQPEKRAAAIRALGLIRDAMTLPLLKDLLQTSDDPKINVASLVAMSRLNAVDIDADTRKYFSPGDNIRRLKLQIDSLNILLDEADGIVLPRAQLITNLSTLGASVHRLELKEPEPSTDHTSINHEPINQVPINHAPIYRDLIISYIQAMGRSQAAVFEQPLSRYSKNNVAAIREAALVSLALLGTRRSSAIFTSSLPGQSVSIIRNVVKNLSMRKYRFPDQLVRVLFADNTKRNLALDILRLSARSDASNLFNSLVVQTEDPQALAALMILCIESNLEPQTVEDSVWEKLPIATKVPAVNCLLQSRTADNAAASSIKRNLSMHHMLNAILVDPAIHLSTKHLLLIKASKNNRTITKTMLSPRLEKMPPAWILPSLKAIRGNGDASSFSPQLWSMLKDENATITSRLYAAILLLDPKQHYEAPESDIHVSRTMEESRKMQDVYLQLSAIFSEEIGND